MGRVTVNLKGKLGILSRSGVDRRTQKDMAEAAIDGIKRQTSVGNSPVQGYGRFEAYSTQRGPVPDILKKRYPFNAKAAGKKVRPVNLRLTGELMDKLSMRFEKNKILVGYFNPPRELKEKIDSAQNGEPEKNVPQRKFLPGKGERFTESIMRRIKNALVNGLKSKLR